MSAKRSSPSGSVLFVYGTLLAAEESSMGRAQRQRLARESRMVGEAAVRGRLYDLGRYPGLVLAVDDGDLVHGHVLELTTPVATLAWLDAYEGIVPGGHPHNEYERRLVDAVLDDGSALSAWGYVYCHAIADKRPIASGRWLDRES